MAWRWDLEGVCGGEWSRGFQRIERTDAEFSSVLCPASERH